MIYKFHAYGHPNILGTHKTTLEFTKDKEVTLKGNCIVGVKADFNLSKIREFIKKLPNDKITITLTSSNNKIQDTISAEINQNFNSYKEFVIRKTNFISKRTFATSSNKAALELKRDLIYYLRGNKNKIIIIIENKQE